jgi:hypothetical protein
MSCVAYVACKMTGRDKLEMVRRAKYVCKTLRRYNIEPISPVMEEQVQAERGKLTNHDKPRLKIFWKRDKDIIRYESHVVLIDQAQMKSFGIEREYMLQRGVLWKPVVLVVEPGTALSVAEFEDDAVMYSVDQAARYIQQMWGTRWKRWKWRVRMLDRSLPKWFYDQLMAWR